MPGVLDGYSKAAARAALFAVVFVIGGQTLISAVNGLMDWRLAQTPPEDVFEYFSVEYVSTEPEDQGIRMASTAVWHRQIDRVTWNDRLVCEEVAFSSLDQAADGHEAKELGTNEWVYTADYPDDGRRCVMHAHITAQIGGATFSQRIESSPFIP